jgi:hypothetical protein
MINCFSILYQLVRTNIGDVVSYSKVKLKKKKLAEYFRPINVKLVEITQPLRNCSFNLMLSGMYCIVEWVDVETSTYSKKGRCLLDFI